MSDPVIPKPNRWLKRGLFLSLAVNLLIVGIVAGALLRPGSGPGGKSPAPRPPVEWMQGVVRQLPEDAQAELRKGFLNNRGELRRIRSGFRATRQEMMRILETEPYDPQAMEALMRQQDAAWRSIVAKGQMLFLDTIAAMTAEERAQFVQNLKENRDKDGRRGDKRPRGD